MTVIAERLPELAAIHLDSGAHNNFDNGHCAMEVVSWLAGEGFTDAPACASPVLRAFTIAVNDQWDDAQRQTLVPYLPRMVGTADDGKDEARSFLALDWLIRTFTPTWLDLAGLTVEAAALRDLRRIVDMVSAEAASPVVRVAETKAAAAWDAARAAARAAAEAAAWDAAWDAARAAAEAAAWDAARAAAGDAARDAARDAAEAAAWDAAWDAAGDAARAAAEAALKPTVETLQASALDLLDAMIDGEVPT
jgi:hypothetical protein